MSCYECNPENCIHYNLESSKILYKQPNESKPKDYKEGDWIVVIYNKIWYPGVIIQIEKDNLITKFLEYRDNYFQSPYVDDIQTVFKTQVLCEIEAPVTANKKKYKTKTYQFSEQTMKFVNAATKSCKIYEL